MTAWQVLRWSAYMLGFSGALVVIAGTTFAQCFGETASGLVGLGCGALGVITAYLMEMFHNARWDRAQERRVNKEQG